MPAKKYESWNMARRRSAEAPAGAPARRPPLKELKEIWRKNLEDRIGGKEISVDLINAMAELNRLERTYADFWKELKGTYGDALEMFAENAIVEATRPLYLARKERAINSIRTSCDKMQKSLSIEFVVRYAKPVVGNRAETIDGFKYLLRQKYRSYVEYRTEIEKVISRFREGTAWVITDARKLPSPLNNDLEEAYINARKRIIDELRK